jgi:hypothetical protein
MSMDRQAEKIPIKFNSLVRTKKWEDAAHLPINA